MVLAFAVARLWTDVYSNAVDPGWVKTRMGGTDAAALGRGATSSTAPRCNRTPPRTTARCKDGLLAACAQLSGMPLPG